MRMMKAGMLILACSILLPVTGCSNAHKKDVKVVNTMVCKAVDAPLSSEWVFDMNSNNQILSIRLNTDITYEKMQEALPKGTKQDFINIYMQQGEKLGNDYDYIQNKYPDKSWFKSEFNYDDSTMNIHSSYLFNISNERFNYELENGLLNEFGLDNMYNEKKKGFFYDESSIQNNLFGNTQMKCETLRSINEEDLE